MTGSSRLSSWPSSRLFAAVLALSGCYSKGADSGWWDEDLDGDGFSPSEGDCDEHNSAISPEASETPGDGVDQNCDASDAGPVLALSDSDGVWSGASPWGRAGWSVDAGSDVDGDGFDDLLIGAPAGEADGGEQGMVHLVHGPATPGGSLADADSTMASEKAYDIFGYAVASAGDVNADGFDDVVVGAANNHTTGRQAGLVTLGLGPDLAAEPWLLGSSGRVTGTAITGGFDMDGDGITDTHVGSPSVGTDPDTPGRTDVLLGPSSDGPTALHDTDLTLEGESTLDYAGQSVGAGDINGDGYDDLLVGAPLSSLDGDHAGRAYVVFGPREGVVSLVEADLILRGEREGAEAGISVAAIGDLDGDGADDWAVGAILDDEAGTRAGKVYVLAGVFDGETDLADAEASFQAETTYEMMGRQLAGMRLSDGTSALLAAAPRDPYASGTYPGKVYLLEPPLSGELRAEDVALVFAGTMPGEEAGKGLSSGDLDGDGRPDVIIGAPYNEQEADDGGAVYISLGATRAE